MKARPILMHARSIQNLLAGRKTQTRRIVKPQPLADGAFAGTCCTVEDDDVANLCPYGQPGDLMWVRETISIGEDADDSRFVGYAADRSNEYIVPDDYEPPKNAREVEHFKGTPDRWVEYGPIPSIFMPRWASRLTLELTEVRVQQLLDISINDILAEGVDCPRHGRGPCNDSCGELGELFKGLWDYTNGVGAFDKDPWIWALTFKVHRCNVDDLLRQREAA